MSAPSIVINKWNERKFDQIIDVRSPSEYKLDHIPNSINLPVLSDSERDIVGKIYKKSSFEARKLGSIFITKNISKHLKKSLNDKPNNYEALIYCWRGGKRSESLSKIFSSIGWKNYVLSGGYKSYRNDVINDLDDISEILKIIILSGYTGLGKTEIIEILNDKGLQTLNLEKLACHRGSLLGKIKNLKQPSQSFFESKVLEKIRTFDVNKPVIIEAESSKIGNLLIPRGLWKNMHKSPSILLKTDNISSRIKFLINSYGEITKERNTLISFLNKIQNKHSKEIIKTLKNMVKSNNWENFTNDIIKHHFDPSYQKSSNNHNRKIISVINQEECNNKIFLETSNKIIKIVKN